MKHLVLTLTMSAIWLSACDKTETPSPVDTQVTTKMPKVKPPQKRMSRLVGRSLVIQKAQPDQMRGNCTTVAAIRNNKSVCHNQIYAIAETASFTTQNCSKQGNKIICRGAVKTKIGSANVVAEFRQNEDKWQGKITKIVEGTWKRKN
jgi:hypothetical protein